MLIDVCLSALEMRQPRAPSVLLLPLTFCHCGNCLPSTARSGPERSCAALSPGARQKLTVGPACAGQLTFVGRRRGPARRIIGRKRRSKRDGANRLDCRVTCARFYSCPLWILDAASGYIWTVSIRGTKNIGSSGELADH